MDHVSLARTILRCLGLASIIASIFYGGNALITTLEGGSGSAVIAALVAVLPGAVGGLATFLLAGPLSRLAASGPE